MSLVIPDFRLVAMILADPTRAIPKRTHRWPAGTTRMGTLCRPKMAEGSHHNVYEIAPHGKYGNPYAPPLLTVEIRWVEDGKPSDWLDEDMVHEGFDSVYTYGLWWDRWRQGKKNCGYWAEMQDEAFWVCAFEPIGKTEFFARRAHQYAAENGLL